MQQRDAGPPIAILGGGICGLTTALALERRGFTVEVYEAAPEYRPVGAGILLQTNALVALQELGLATEVVESGKALSDVRIRSPSGRVLQAFDLDREQEAFGHRYVAIHRADLLEILRRNVSSPVHTGKKCTHVSDPIEPTVRFDDGTQIHPGIVVGADGIHSTVRETITTVSERSLETTVVRAVTSVPLDERYECTGFEVWGNGTYTGGAPIGEDRFYWFATVPEELPDAASVDAIRSFYTSYPTPIPAIIETVTAEDIISTKLIDLPPVDQWSRGSTVLAGDAVHGMLPFAGQGAAQSIEDALALASALDSHRSVSEAFAEYESQRISRANKIRTEAHVLGQLGTMQSAVACWLRNAAAMALPETVVNRFRHRRVANASLPPTVSSKSETAKARHQDEQLV